MNDHNFYEAKNWFEDLRNQLIKIITEIDGSDFIKTNWTHRHQGGGTMAKIRGSVVEKGGVNISSVSGKCCPISPSASAPRMASISA